MLITLITPTYNRRKWLKETLESVLAQDTQGVEVEYFVVDNNSSDDTRALIEKIAADSLDNPKMNPSGIRLKYLFEPRQGINFARNTGIENSRGEWLVFFDDDVILNPGALAAYIRAFREFPAHGIFGGGIALKPPPFALPSWLVSQGPYARTMIVLGLDYGQGNLLRRLDKDDMPIGPNMGFAKSVFREHGVFRTDFGLSGKSLVPGAEYELFLRYSGKGLKEWVYVGQAVVQHPIKEEQATKAYFRKRIFGVGRVMYRLHPMLARWRIFGIPVYIYTFLAQNLLKCLAWSLRGKAVEAFYYQCEFLMYCGYVYQGTRFPQSQIKL